MKFTFQTQVQQLELQKIQWLTNAQRSIASLQTREKEHLPITQHLTQWFTENFDSSVLRQHLPNLNTHKFKAVLYFITQDFKRHKSIYETNSALQTAYMQFSYDVTKTSTENLNY